MNYLKIHLIAVCLFIAVPVFSQHTDYDKMTLSDLMNIKIKVASIKELSAAESPGIITVISGEEIRTSGARDLMDILETVPGFDFGMDVQGVIGLGVRGNWAHEGKALLLIDGQVMNEGLYSTLQFGNHYSLNNIKRIEIIRGPGSAIYGDYAEYAVINIITDSPQEINGINATMEYGQMKQSYARRGGSFSAGKAYKNYAFDFKGSYLEGNRSDDIYKDAFGNSYDLTNHSKLNNRFINLGFRYKGFSVRAISDIYHTATADEYQKITDKANDLNFENYFLEVKHKLQLSEKSQVTNWITFKHQTPWYSKISDAESSFNFNVTNRRYTANSQLQWDPIGAINITGGIEAYYDISEKKLDNNVFSSTNEATLDYRNTALYGQLLWKNRIATVTMGARQNFNSNYQSNLVPRFGLTRSIGIFHFKALYSMAYRAPGAQNIDLGKDIRPEKTSVTEFETGCQVNKHLYIVMNAYDLETKDPIIYYYDTVTNYDAYINKMLSGTQGIETEVNYRGRWGHIRSGYAWYTAAGKDILEAYSIPGETTSLLGLANKKFFTVISAKVNRNLNISAQAIARGKRYYIASVDDKNQPVYRTEQPSVKLNLTAELRNFLNRNFSLSAGIYNVFDRKEQYLQPYNSLHGPLPGTGRELMIKISYQWNDSDK